MARNLSVKMFDVGFGDCFLVEIPVKPKPMRILFDCGRHTGGKPANQTLANDVIAASRDPDGQARIDLVVATHRHKDHVSGFAADGWDKVAVREVWMPWTENPVDPRARGIVERQVAAAALALKAFGPAAALDPTNRCYAGLMGLALTNEEAMDTLYNGFAGKPERRYLPDEQDPNGPLTVKGYPGVRFHVMGPSRDESTLTVMDPPKAETFRKLAAAGAIKANGISLRPFPESWARPTNTSAKLLAPGEEDVITQLSSRGELAALSAAVDKAINNTSLVVMIEVGKAFLLFCADAQWGNWQNILAQRQWRELIGNTTFLKVGHHASHNASPVTLIDELLPKGIKAMISVDPEAYSNVPYTDLLTAFGRRRFKTARSDQPGQVPAGFTVNGNVVSAKVGF